MRKEIVCLVLGLMITGFNSSMADEVYTVHTEEANPTTLEKLQTKTEETAKDLGVKTQEAAQKTGDFVMEKSSEAAEVAKDGAIKAGHAPK